MRSTPLWAGEATRPWTREAFADLRAAAGAFRLGLTGAFAAWPALAGRVAFYAVCLMVLGAFWGKVGASRLPGTLATRLPPGGLGPYVGVTEWIVISVVTVQLRFEDEVRSGALEARLLRPRSWGLLLIAEAAGGTAARMVAIAPAALALLVLSGLWPGPQALARTALLAVGGAVLTLLVYALVGPVGLLGAAGVARDADRPEVDVPAWRPLRPDQPLSRLAAYPSLRLAVRRPARLCRTGNPFDVVGRIGAPWPRQAAWASVLAVIVAIRLPRGRGRRYSGGRVMSLARAKAFASLAAVRSALADRTAFWLQAGGMLGEQRLLLLLWLLFFTGFREVGGWRLADMQRAWIGVVYLLFGLSSVFLGGYRDLAGAILRGDIDPLLTQPGAVLPRLLSRESFRAPGATSSPASSC